MFIISNPAGIAGFLFEDWFEGTFRSIESVVLFLFLGSLLMLLAEVLFRQKVTDAKVLPENSGGKELTYRGAFFIGLFQVLALFSGFSRSGSTISGGLFYGLKREEAARFSFLLSVPLILGAGFLQLAKMLLAPSSTGLLAFSWQEALVGIFTSFFAGLLCIKLLMKFLKQNSLIPFVVYRVGLVLLLLVLIL